jgi:rSAM/selenodomain-associated transferase 2
MPAPISVIVPTLNASAELPRMAEGLLPGVTSGLVNELILSDGGSEDKIAEAARALGAQLLEGAPGRGGQIARGVARAQGPWLLLLHADTELSPEWPDTARRHMRDRPDKAGYFRLAFDAVGAAPRLVAGWANTRSRLMGLPFGDQGLLVPRALLDSVGGIPELPLMEDVALARALRGKLHPLDATATTSAARYLSDGWLRRGGANLLRLTRYLLGADPARLARGYDRR